MTETELALRRGLGIPDDAARVLVLAESSHWDPDWLLCSEEYYRRFVEGNLESALDALEEEPARVYSVECVFFLRVFWERRPERREQLRRLVNARRVRLSSSGVTTADTLLPSTEAILRDWLLGQEWLRSRGMDQEPRLAYFTDSFGASSSLPSLLRAAGFDRTAITRVDGMYFIGCDWEPRRRFPRPGSSAELLLDCHRSIDFVWRDANGAEVLCHWNAFGYGMGDMLAHRGVSRVYIAHVALPARSERHVERRIASYVRRLAPVSRTPYLFCPMGMDFVAPVHRLIDLVDRCNRTSYVRTGTWVVNAGLDDYLALVDCRRDRLPVVALDPNPYWTGFYSSRPALKRQCRELVDSLVCAEALVASAPSVQGDADAARSLAEAWWVAATSNHHDFITGTSPDPVVEGEQLPWLRAARATAESVIARCGVSMGAGGPAPKRSEGDARWVHEGDRLRLETHRCSVELSSARGGALVRLGSRDAGLEIRDDLVVYRDSGGLWRMGHEFRGGSLVACDRASRHPVTVTFATGPESGPRTRLILRGATIVRELRDAAVQEIVTGRIEGRAAAGTTVCLSLRTGLHPAEITMAEPGGLAVRPLRRHYVPTYWPAQEFVHVADPERGLGLAVLLRHPTGAAWRDDGTLELVALRNATKEHAWRIVPLLANPARGFEMEDAIFEYGLMATTGASLREADLSGIVRARASLWTDDVVAPPAATVEGPDDLARVGTVKGADRGGGLIVRLLSPRPPKGVLTVALRGRAIRAAWRCDVRERDVGELPVRDGRALVTMDGTVATVRIVAEQAR